MTETQQNPFIRGHRGLVVGPVIGMDGQEHIYSLVPAEPGYLQPFGDISQLPPTECLHIASLVFGHGLKLLWPTASTP